MGLAGRDLSFRRGKTTILDGVSLTVARDGILALLGPSGAGKSTLLHILAGLERPTSGQVEQDGRVVNSATDRVDPARRRVAMIFQSLALWPHMTLLAHLDFVMDRERYPHRKARHQRGLEILAFLGLADRAGARPQELSGGEQQRLAIGRALAQEPAYLLMDEPFSSLDDRRKEELLALTRSLPREHGTGILYVTHAIDEALALADGLLVLDRGRITAGWQGKELHQCDRATILAAYA